ncbi:hypothetical protein C2S51_034438 [Perilla frutescens var. frutescens]|nr:hypothetical protein C2S51_034438 [Perilla frutescens var. frutescens]
MVCFKDVTDSGNTYLTIMDYERQPAEKVTTTWTREVPFAKASSAWVLESLHHRPTSQPSLLPTLGRRIVEEGVTWGDNVNFVGEFHYFYGYWEWTEDILSRCESELRQAGIFDSVYASLFTYDRSTEIMKAFCEAWCPLTNTLLTSSGELSISLWDLHFLSGLPVYGAFYDEVVPCTEELKGTNREVYQRPPPRKESKTAPQSTHNPTSDLKAYKPWTGIETVPFVRLGIKEKRWKEAYLAAHIACWLCCFVLPDGDGNLIRPDTFKMASMMAAGKRVSLTIPVLTSIYRGLNNISNSLDLSTAFPVHFVYSWVAHYFKTHFLFERKTHTSRMIQYSGEGGARQYDFSKARKRIFQGDISWNCTMFTGEDYVKSFVDDDAASESEQCFFMAIRSNYLIRRLSKRFVVEPYSPHCFSRQFGFYQIIPGVLAQDIREAPLDDGFKYWRICMRRHSNLKVCFPNLIASAKRFLSPGYKSWWDQTYRSFLEEKIMTLILHKTDEAPKSKKKNISPPKNNTPEGKKEAEAADPPKDNTSKGKKKVEEVNPSKDKRKMALCLLDDSTSSNGEHHFKRQRKHVASAEDHAESKDLRNNHETVDFDRLLEPQSDELIKAKPVPPLEAISEFNVKALFDKHRKSYLQNCWSELRNKVLRTPPEFMSYIQEEVLGGFSQMKAFSGDFDMSFLEKSLDELFTTAAAYDKVRSSSFESEGLSTQRLEEIKCCIRNAETRSNEEIGQIQSIEEELADLEERHTDLCISLKEHQISHDATQKEIKGFEEELAKLKNVSKKQAAEKVEGTKSLLESAQKALEDQDPFA